MSDKNDTGDRRQFLARSSVVLAMFAAASFGGTDALADKLSTTQLDALKTTLKTSISNGKLDETELANLPKDVSDILRKMTPDDWAAAGKINAKLQGLDTFATGDNNGYAGM